MKRFFSILLTVVVAFSLAACFEFPHTEPETVYYGLNEVVNVNSIEITATKIQTSSGDGSMNSVTAGKVYVGVEFSVTNKRSQSFPLSSILCFKAKGDDRALSQSILASSLFGGNNIDDTLPSGETVIGWYCFQVSEGWQQIKVTFTPDIMSTKDFALFRFTA